MEIRTRTHRHSLGALNPWDEHSYLLKSISFDALFEQSVQCAVSAIDYIVQIVAENS
jgi:hypothetical protein